LTNGGPGALRLYKRIFRSGPVHSILCWIGAQYIRLVYRTSRWQMVGGDTPQKFWDQNKPFILCFWHGRLLMMPYCWNRRSTIHMLISQHRDGQLIARTTGHFGIRTISGSTTHGGAAALRAMLQKYKSGDCIGITPDGPSGPRMHASDGVVQFARLSGAAILPATYSFSRRKLLSTWDRFMIPWPFGRGVIIWGSPITVPRDADADGVEAARKRVEEGLNAITDEADRFCGGTPVLPAELPTI